VRATSPLRSPAQNLAVVLKAMTLSIRARFGTALRQQEHFEPGAFLGRPNFSAIPWQHPSQRRLGREWECRPGVAKSVRPGTVEPQGGDKENPRPNTYSSRLKALIGIIKYIPTVAAVCTLNCGAFREVPNPPITQNTLKAVEGEYASCIAEYRKGTKSLTDLKLRPGNMTRTMC
jgi:hypothetical protein